MSSRLVIALAAALHLAVLGEPPPLPLTVVPKCGQARPELDGKLDDPFWGQAADMGLFLTADGRGMPQAATRARVARTDAALWIAVECAEPRMNRLRTKHFERDSRVWADDCIEVFVQRPETPYLHFVVNARAAQFDEKVKDARWDAQWQAAANRGSDRWSVEVCLPWTALDGPPRYGDTWRLNLCRSRRAEFETSAWSPTGGGFHQPDRFGHVRFTGEPWPSKLQWHVISRLAGRVDVAWEPQAQAQHVALSVNGKATQGAFSFGREGAIALRLDALWQGETILRASHVVTIAPMSTAFKAAEDRLRGIDPTVKAIAGTRAEMQQQLESLRHLASTAAPALSAEFVRQAQRIEARASHLAVKAAMLKEGANPKSVVYGIETSLRKLLRHRPFEGQPGGPLRLDAARREMDAGQVVVFAFDVPLLQLLAEIADAKGDGGRILPQSAFRVRRVGYIPTVKPTYHVEHVGLWPDPLMKAAAFDVQPGGFESLWVDVRVPADAAPGLYRGTLRLDAPNARPTVVPVEVRVRAFTIPVKPSLRTAFGLAPRWRVKQDQDAFVRNALEHRVTPYSVSQPTLIEPPAMDWSKALSLEAEVSADGQGCLSLVVVPAKGKAHSFPGQAVGPGKPQRARFDLSRCRGMVQSWRLSLPGPTRATATVRLLSEGKPPITLAEGERRAVLGHDGWLQQWPSWEWSAWDEPDVAARWDWTAFDETVEKYLPLGLAGHRAGLRSPRAGWAREWERHLREKGWLHLAYTYLFDEPLPEDYPKLNRVMGEVKRAAPGLMNMMTARQFPPELHYVDIWCPEAYSFDPEAAKAEQARGRAVWWYVAFSTRHPYPDVWIDYPALDCRVWPWMTWKHDLDGMLYWSVTAWWRGDPWQTGQTFPGANGDGSLLYPGRDGQPVDSIRWECLRDGFEDYEVLCLLDAGARELQAKGQQPELVNQARALAAIDDRVVKSYKEYNPDPAALVAARRQMSDALERVVAELGHEPKITGRPRHRPGVDLSALAKQKTVEPESAPAPTWKLPGLEREDDLVLRYSFDESTPFAFDRSGCGMHGTVASATRVAHGAGRALRFSRASSVALPPGAVLLGPQPQEGAVAVWVRPDFNPSDVPTGPWEGYHVIFYIMETDGNGLPDGYDEIGLYVHGPRLYARCAGKESAFTSVPSPLRRGAWTHLCITWKPGERCLYVDGKAAARVRRAFPLPKLDDFAGCLGIHPPARRWPWRGDLDELRVYRRCLAAADVARLAK